MVQFEAWHGKTLAEHEALRNQWAAQGYRFSSLSIYGAVNAPVFAAVMVKQAVPVAQRDFPVMTASQWQQTFDAQAQQGYGPIILAATGTAADPRFAAVFEPQASIPLTRHGLTSGAYTDLNIDIDLYKGLKPQRRDWILKNGDVEEVDGLSDPRQVVKLA